MGKQWVMVADRTRARIFENDGDLDKLNEIEDLLNPEGRFSDAEFHHDAKGRFCGKGDRQHAHTAQPRVSKAVHDEENFSRQLAAVLDRGCQASQYDSLVVVAPPAFLGILRKQLSDQVDKRIVKQLNSDISGYAPQQVSDYLKRHLH
ncbi:MAG: host attachment protein [Betaproteobacteria bacterium]